MNNPYLDLTAQFNRVRLRALLSSGQAVVAHRLAIMSKDGDWIVREDAEALGHVLRTLGAHGARYRFGAPLDPRWLAGGWSSHLEFRADGLRLRTDFVSRPPRISAELLATMWNAAEASGDPVVGLEPLAALKLTDREKDYAVVGELARKMTGPAAQLRWSRSSLDLIRLAHEHPDTLSGMVPLRPLLAHVAQGRDRLDEELDRERRTFMRINQERLAAYRRAAEPWATAWPQIAAEIASLPLDQAHALAVARAEELLPFAPSDGDRSW